VHALVVASPSGFARLITQTGTPDEGQEAPASKATDMDLFLCVSAELGDEILGPPGALPDSIEIQTADAGDRAGSSGKHK